jgi:hypothetical protein
MRGVIQINDKVERAFNDAFELAAYATTVIDDQNYQNICTKYFNEEDRANVRQVVTKIWHPLPMAEALCLGRVKCNNLTHETSAVIRD